MGAVNIGVAAHITAASQGGPRYDAQLDPAHRRAARNGVWLCQNCAKLVDSDPTRCTVKRLNAWKDEAEELARIELETLDVGNLNRFVRAEQLAPHLIAEMRNDLQEHPLDREFVLLRRGWVFNGSDVLCYYYDEHPELDNLVRILENMGLIRDVTQTNVKRFRMTEELVDYLSR